MSEAQQTLIQLLAPVATSVVMFYLVGRTKERVAAGVALSTVLATIVVMWVVVAKVGVTSTLSIGFVWTAMVAFAVSAAVMAGLYGLFRSHSG